MALSWNYGRCVLDVGRGGVQSARRTQAQRGYASATVCTVVLVVAWVMALSRVPAGWPVIALNGGGYVLSVLILAGGYDQVKRALRPFHSFLIMAATWLVLVFGLRAALLWLLA